MDILDDMRVSKLSAKVLLKVNSSFKRNVSVSQPSLIVYNIHAEKKTLLL